MQYLDFEKEIETLDNQLEILKIHMKIVACLLLRMMKYKQSNPVLMKNY
jgi:hypothetical protein